MRNAVLSIWYKWEVRQWLSHTGGTKDKGLAVWALIPVWLMHVSPSVRTSRPFFRDHSVDGWRIFVTHRTVPVPVPYLVRYKMFHLESLIERKSPSANRSVLQINNNFRFHSRSIIHWSKLFFRSFNLSIHLPISSTFFRKHCWSSTRIIITTITIKNETL